MACRSEIHTHQIKDGMAAAGTGEVNEHQFLALEHHIAHMAVAMDKGCALRDVLKDRFDLFVLFVVQNPALVKDAVNHFGGRIAVGIDAKNEMVATEGWLDTSNVHYIEMAKMMEAVGVQTIIYTDISKDGMLSGVNGEQLDAINRAVSCGIIASGGVKSIADIELCKQLNLYGVICGKSIYSGTLDLAEAIAEAKKSTL